MLLKLKIINLTLLLAMTSGAYGEEEATPEIAFPYSIMNHQLEIALDLDRNYINAHDLITLKRELKKPESLSLLLRLGLDVTEVKIGDTPVEFDIAKTVDPYAFEAAVDSEDVAFYGRTQAVNISIPADFSKRKEMKLSIRYEGIISDSVESGEFSREYIMDQITGVIDSSGIYLGAEAVYYPLLPSQVFTYTLTVTVPEPFQCITEGDLQEEYSDNGKTTEKWVCEYPIDGFHIIGGKYIVNRVDHNGIEVSTFFFPEQADLSERYLEACKGYLDLYNELLGPYQFGKFAVVDNFFASGYGMPSYTLLGSQVLRLPFIIYSSLGHEICHNWWGNSVYVDYKSGNWCEGLTVYCADYLYKEKKSAADAKDYRIGTLHDYTAYTNAGNDFPLSEFRSRHNPAQRAVGYGKSAMLFHMLRAYVGEDDFWRSLQRFYQDNLWTHASWKDIQKAFERESAIKLGWFFEQWVGRTGAPALEITEPFRQKSDQTWEISFTLNQTQADDHYVLEVPIVIHGAKQDVHLRAGVNMKSESIKLNSIFEPLSFSVDPDFDLFRRLKLDEVAPTLADVFGKEELLFVLPSQTSAELLEAYRELAKELTPRGTETAKIINDYEFFAANVESGAVIFMGKPSENQAIPASWMEHKQWSIQGDFYNIAGDEFNDPHTTLVAVQRNPDNKEIPICYISSHDAEDISEIGRKLRHYGKYSFLVFEADKNVAKGNWEVEDSPLTHKF